MFFHCNQEGKNTHNPLVILVLATECSFFVERNGANTTHKIGFLILHRSKLYPNTYVKYLQTLKYVGPLGYSRHERFSYPRSDLNVSD
jgi:hypothetical protein